MERLNRVPIGGTGQRRTLARRLRGLLQSVRAIVHAAQNGCLTKYQKSGHGDRRQQDGGRAPLLRSVRTRGTPRRTVLSELRQPAPARGDTGRAVLADTEAVDATTFVRGRPSGCDVDSGRFDAQVESRTRSEGVRCSCRRRLDVRRVQRAGRHHLFEREKCACTEGLRCRRRSLQDRLSLLCLVTDDVTR